MRPRRVALRSVRGQAMVISIIVMAALAIGVVAVMLDATSQQGATAREQSSQRALTLADAGVSDALSVLSNATNPLDPLSLPPSSSPADGGGISAYTGALVGTTWTITGTGTLPSSVAGAGPLTRTSTLEVAVTTNATPWNYVFADSSSGCLTLRNNAQIATPLYSRGNLCLRNNARVTGSPVAVDGTVDLRNNASIGTAAVPVAQAALGGCTTGGGPAHPCSQADRVYVTTLTQSASGLVKPAIDLAGWYANAKPGPSHPCTSGSVPGGLDTDTTLNGSRGTFALTPATTYNCQYWENGALVGELAWDPASRTLTIQGTVLVDGSIQLSGNATYAGRGTVYATRQITSSSNTHLCGVAACDASWDPDTNLLVLVAGEPAQQDGIQFRNNTVFQGALYAVNDYRAANNVVNWGPVIARELQFSNNAQLLLKSIGSIPPGAPGSGATLQVVGGTWRGH
jgi:hypothetical protein